MNKKNMNGKGSLLLLFLFSFSLFTLSSISAWNFEGGGFVVNQNITVNGTHNQLAGLQGGTVGEYYHLNQTVYNAIAANYSLWITSAGADSFIANFTNFSRIYANVTLYNTSWSNITNLTYFIGYNYAVNSTGGSDSFIANYTNFTTLYTNQVGNASGNFIANTNVTYAYALNDSLWSTNYSNFSIGWLYAVNSTGGSDSFIANYTNFTALYGNQYTNYTNVTAYSNALSWVANYSTYLLKPTWAQVTNTTLVALNGSINTWNANQSYVNNYIINGTGGAYIQHNGTGWVIKG